MASPKPQTQKRICIGKITSAHGVKGLVKILPFCEDVNLLNGSCYIGENDDKALNIKIKNRIGKYILAQIKGVTTPEEAKTLKYSLFVLRETLPNIEGDDSFYIEDMIGLSVLNDNQEIIGELIAVPNFGAGNLLEIKPVSGASYFLPFQDEFVTDINLEQNTITVDNADKFKIE